MMRWPVRSMVEHAAVRRIDYVTLRTELQLGAQLTKQSDMPGDIGV
jgi:hypothetical protein